MKEKRKTFIVDQQRSYLAKRITTNTIAPTIQTQQTIEPMTIAAIIPAANLTISSVEI